jgi:hypothetical protein
LKGELWQALRAPYGLRESPHLWQDEFAEVAVSLGWVRCKSDAGLYWHPEGGVLCVHVDDIFVAAPGLQVEKRLSQFRKHFELKDDEVLSSMESELLACNSLAVDAKFLQTLVSELTGVEPPAQLFTDSSSCLQLMHKRGCGRARHLAVKEIWLQDELRAGRLSINYIPSSRNVADIMTKALPRDRHETLRSKLGLGVMASSVLMLGSSSHVSAVHSLVIGMSMVRQVSAIEESEEQEVEWFPVVAGTVLCLAVLGAWHVAVKLSRCCRRSAIDRQFVHDDFGTREKPSKMLEKKKR